MIFSALLLAALTSTVFNWDSLPAKPTKIGVARAGVNAPVPSLHALEFHVTTLNPGQRSHPPHQHPQEEMIVLKEGTLDAFVNGKHQTIGPGSMLFLASYDWHNVTNIGATPATYYVINCHTAATETVRKQPAHEWEPAGMLHSSVIDWTKLVAKPTPTGFRRELIDSRTLTYAHLEVHETTMNPGTPASKPHHHPGIELIIMKQGAMDATVDGVTRHAGPGSLIYISSDAVQSMRNPGNVPADYLVIQVTSAEALHPASS